MSLGHGGLCMGLAVVVVWGGGGYVGVQLTSLPWPNSTSWNFTRFTHRRGPLCSWEAPRKVPGHPEKIFPVALIATRVCSVLRNDTLQPCTLTLWNKHLVFFSLLPARALSQPVVYYELGFMISAKPEKNTKDFVLFTPKAPRMWVYMALKKKKKNLI